MSERKNKFEHVPDGDNGNSSKRAEKSKNFGKTIRNLAKIGVLSGMTLLPTVGCQSESRKIQPSKPNYERQREEEPDKEFWSKVAPENIETVKKIIRTRYVDEVDPNIESVDSLLGLDPHTRYIPKPETGENIKAVSRQFLLPDGKTGYIKLDSFRKSSDAEVSEAIDILKKQGMQQLVLDLRYNSGGYFTSATAIADRFLQPEKLIVYTEGRAISSYAGYYSISYPQWEGPLIILINTDTASASEIVAGALQDHDRAIIVGELSFGKGLVQKSFKFKNGDILRLTTKRWYLPSRRNVQRSYKPWESVGRYSERAYDTEKRMSNLGNKPTALTKGGRVVTHHSGIVPDTTISDERAPEGPVRKLVDQYGNTLNSFAVEYLNEHDIKLSLGDFVKYFKVSDMTLKNFKKVIAGTDSVLAFKIDNPEFDDELRYLLKREIGFVKYGPRGHLALDEQLHKAVGVFSEEKRLLSKGAVKQRE